MLESSFLDIIQEMKKGSGLPQFLPLFKGIVIACNLLKKRTLSWTLENH